MKKLAKYALIVIVIFLCTGIFTLQYSKISSFINEQDISEELISKGLKGAKDFAIDDYGNYYIAYKDRIEFITMNGNGFVVHKDIKLDIFSIVYLNGELIFASGSNVFKYNIESKKCEEILSNIPNFGDYKESKLIVKDNLLFVTIGSATNSGVVGEDNKWIKDNEKNFDTTPFKITLKDITATFTQGAFTAYNTKNTKNQVIESKQFGNASVIIYDLISQKSSLYAFGIRNITGIDMDSNGKIFIAIGGMENRGNRPIVGDVDYIYTLEKDQWYGWPDYSGGDPIDSPRFTDNNGKKIETIIKSVPNKNPIGPLYQHTSVSSIYAVAVDKYSITSEKDVVYFYDKTDSKLIGINSVGYTKRIININKNSTITQMKFKQNKFIILDGTNGNLFEISKKVESKIILDTNILIIALVVILIIGGTLVTRIRYVK